MRHLTISLCVVVTWLATCAAAQAAWPNDPEFAAWHPWTGKIDWTPPPDPDPGYPAIAVVDTGVSWRLDDFQGYVDSASADCAGVGKARVIRAATDVDDRDGHGTQVAALAAAPANGLGSVGASPLSPLIVVRIRPGDAGDMACAFHYLRGVAKDVPLVVNISQESHATAAATRELTALVKAGALVVAAAGNDNGKPARWPANANHVLAVGRDDNVGATGSQVDVTAPGADLRLPDLATNSWITGSVEGTSYAAPLVAGAAARLWAELGGDPDPQAIAYLLRRTAHHGIGPGFGEIDLGAALRQKVPVSEQEPNDDAGHAVKKSCRRRCSLQGIVAASDDPDDYWRLRGRRTCRGLTGLRASGTRVTCTGRRGVVRLRVHATPRANAAYTIRIGR